MACSPLKLQRLRNGEGNKWAQKPDEIAEFLELLNSEGVRSYLEIGISHGGSFHYIGLGLPTGSRMVGIEHHGVWTPHLVAAMAALKDAGQDAEIIWGDSKNPNVIKQAEERGPYDCVFIDGDHSHAGVAADWRNYGPMARIVAFHDIDAEHSANWEKLRRRGFGVPEVFRDIKRRHRYVAIVSKAEPGMGIGVVWKDLGA